MLIPLQKGESIQSVAAEITDHVVAGLPAERRQMEKDMAATARMLQDTGSLATKEGLGQRVASIPARIYHRWAQLYPGCWKDKQFTDEFLYDNPQCCAPGYKPRPSQVRHGFTFTGGAAIYHSQKANVK